MTHVKKNPLAAAILLFGEFCAMYPAMHSDTPLIIPRADHPISRNLVSPHALKVLYRLKESGHLAYLVGGCVRDLLLGREPKDFDVVTDATPNQVKRIFRNCRLVGRRFRLAHIHFQDEIVEVATFRSSEPEELEGEMPIPMAEGADAGGSRPPRHLRSDDGVILRDNVFGTPEQDARRRDFTVNALAYNIADFSIIDYVGGMADLRQGVIRTIGDPGVRFTEDPVRMLRAVRFAAMLGFAIEPLAREAIIELAPTITRATPPRLYEEVLKLFLLGEGEKTYQLMRQTRLFDHLFPHFTAWLEREAGGFPHARVGQGLEWIDRWGGAGDKISPPLLLAIMFGEYLEEKAAGFRHTGRAPQEAINDAVAEFLGELAPTVLVPQRIGTAVRDILASRNRFRKIPGKRPQSFVGRPGFADWLAHLQFLSEIAAEEAKTYAWWHAYAGTAATEVPAPALPGAEEKKSPRRRPRRRRRKNTPPAS